MNLSRTSCTGFLIILFFSSCIDKKKEQERLAERHCASCHAFASPALLAKKTWKEDVLPQMAFRMGLDFSLLPNIIDQEELQAVFSTLPRTAMVTQEEWDAIEAYYLREAPDSLPVPESSTEPLMAFEAGTVSLPIRRNTMLTMIRHNPEKQRILAGTRAGKLYELSHDFAPLDSFQLDSPPADMIFRRSGDLVLTMGIMDPNDRRKGKIVRIENERLQIVHDSLKRPVDLQSADLNRDGLDDLIVSSFGNFSGELSILEGSGGGFTGHSLHHMPGNRRTVVKDFNDDGLPDVLALIAQGDEQIALFTNRGNFGFSIRVLLRFPPVYGSSYFETQDFNGDGHFDILYTNGDNADYSMVLKPYHGVRIFLNDGKGQFRESFFYPMPGASQARAADFDQDGDLDIAAISFFPDFSRHPENGFVFLENQHGQYRPYTTPLAASARWITMEVGDFDRDDDADILLAALNFSDGVPAKIARSWDARPTSLLLLRNTLK